MGGFRRYDGRCSGGLWSGLMRPAASDRGLGSSRRQFGRVTQFSPRADSLTLGPRFVGGTPPPADRFCGRASWSRPPASSFLGSGRGHGGWRSRRAAWDGDACPTPSAGLPSSRFTRARLWPHWYASFAPAAAAFPPGRVAAFARRAVRPRHAACSGNTCAAPLLRPPGQPVYLLR